MAENTSYDISPEGCVKYANRFIELCELPFPKISSLQDINSNFLVHLFEHITGHIVADILLDRDSFTEVHNIQALIDTLSLDLLDISLSHLTGEDIANGNVLSILNLLEVLEAVFLYLSPQREKDIGEPLAFVPRNDFVQEAASVKSVVSSSDENIPPKRVLKRKTCRKTLRKPHPNSPVPKKKISEAPQVDVVESSHSKRHPDTVDSSKSPLKRKISKPSKRVKRPHIEDNIEELQKINFENKIKALLHSDESPVLRAQQLKKKYIQNLKTTVRKTPVKPCKKSFLLPHNLRHRNKSSIRQSPAGKRVSQRLKAIKSSVPESTMDKHANNDDAPAMFQAVMDEFPGFKFPKNTLDLLTRNYYQHIGYMHKQLRDTLFKKPKTFIQTKKAMEDEAKLNKILVQDLKEKKYLRELNEQKTVENKIKSGFRNARLQSAKTRQYFDEFHKSMSRKLKKRNFSEEMLIEKTFKEILDIQKEKVRELCQRVKEADEQDAKKHRQYLTALKNLYHEQLTLLAESIDAEKKDSAMRTKAQKWVVEKMNQEFRKKLQTEVRSLQKDVLDLIEDIHFRELDAQNFIERSQHKDS